MLITKKILLSFITGLLVACSASTPTIKTDQPNQNTSTPAVKADLPTTKDIPHWLKKPQLENHISVIGSAGQQRWGGEQAQYLAAMEDAQRRLEDEFKNKNTTALDPNIDEKIKTLLLQQAIVKDEWFDPETGQLYLWLVLPNNPVPTDER